LSCGFGLLAIRFVHPFGEPIQRADGRWMAGTIVFGGIAAPIALLYGLRYTTGLAGALLVNSEMIFTSVLSVLFFGGKLSRSDMIVHALL
jgi:drug/metabolite transporter (DMT)-like permease